MIDLNNFDFLYSPDTGSIKLEGRFDAVIRLFTQQTMKVIDFKALADYFRNQPDPFATGEFWGKMVRGGSMIYKYSLDKELLDILNTTVDDMLSIQGEDGCLSTCPKAVQPKGTQGSDLWERKYVLLGMLEYYDITHRADVLEAMKKLADYTISQVGPAPKTPITQTGWAFCGIESSSILEPIVKLYHITKKQDYLDFASYIVNSGACRRENLFEAIYNGKDPMDIGKTGVPTNSIAKAYEMMSCFEGLIEYYRATGIKKYKDTALKFYDKLIEQEITLLGSGGADAPFNLGPGTGEQWNHTRFEQTNPKIDLMMETCVTVTWMKLCHQLLRLTGNASIADEIEKSAYNIFIGAVRPDGRFFEYFPRFNGIRNPKVNYSFNIKGFDLSCCTANAPSGLGLIPRTAFMEGRKGPAILFYVNGSATLNTPTGKCSISSVTKYPAKGEYTATITEIIGDEDYTISLRIPSWCNNFRVWVNSEIVESNTANSWFIIKRKWAVGDTISLSMALPLRVVPAPIGSNPAGHSLAAIVRGPIVLTRDASFGENIDEVLSLGLDGTVSEIECIANKDHEVVVKISDSNDKEFTMIDYSTSGLTWDERSKFRTWLPV